MWTPTPSRVYHALRDQLGSIRGVYLAGNRVVRRSDFRQHRENVLLLHGYFQTRAIWSHMEDRLRFAGYGVVSFDLGGLWSRFNTDPLDRLALRVAEKVEALSHRHGVGRLHVVGHSMGGLVARRYVQHLGGDRRVRSLVTLGTPHHGTPTAYLGVAIGGVLAGRTSAHDLLPRSRVVTRLNSEEWPADIPMLSIYSTGDLVCPSGSSTLVTSDATPHVRNLMIPGVGHSALTWDDRVVDAVLAHLGAALRLPATAAPRAG
jgi:triacylglycerol lipase